jgi:Flp pilus assembly pilin Flp
MPDRAQGVLTMNNFLVCFAKNDSGSTTIEYGMIVSAVSVAIVAIVFLIGSKFGIVFATINSYLQ